jgi:hypothetical protein
MVESKSLWISTWVKLPVIMAGFIPHCLQSSYVPFTVTQFCQQPYHYWKHFCRPFPVTCLSDTTSPVTRTCVLSRGFSFLGTGSNWQQLDLERKEVVEAKTLVYQTRPMIWCTVMEEQPDSWFPKMCLDVFTIDSFSQIAKNVSVHGLVEITLFWNKQRQWIPH